MNHETHSAEDVELLARELMGWRVNDAGCMWDERGNERSTVWPWNPFTDARHDVMVLERVRETWADQEWESGGPAEFISRLQVFGTELIMAGREKERDLSQRRFPLTGGPLYAAAYSVGNYARAAVAVLKGK